MMCNWKTLGLVALLSTALATTRAPAQDKDDSKLTDSQKLDKIQKQLGEMQQALVALFGVPQDLGIAKLNIARLQEDVGRLEKQLKEMEGRLGQMSGRIAFSPPAPGRIRLRNDFPREMSIRINDRVYRLGPGQDQVLEAQPAGPFTFEVLGVQGAVSRELRPNETYTIFVYPR